MKINKKIHNITLISIICFALIFLILGTFCDLNIANKIADRNNLFGILFTAFGAMVSLSIGCFAGSAIYFCKKKWSKPINIFLDAIGIGAVIILTAYEIKTSLAYTDFARMSNNKEAYNVLIIVLICLINFAIVLFTKKWIKKLDVDELLITCLAMLFLIGIGSMVSEGIKMLANRPRPYEVHASTREFAKWYQFNFSMFLKDCEHSFVSGHVVNSGCTMSLLPLLYTLFAKKPNKKTQIIFAIFGFLFAMFVALSRMIADMHFLSDVAGGLIVTACTQLLVINLLEKVIKIKR